MRTELKLARVGMSMQEATVVKWHKQPGDAFKSGDVLYEIETEKVTQEIAAAGDGIVVEVYVPAGEAVAVGASVCSVDINISGETNPYPQ